ncbi:MAG TPA: helix-hairpin-helix domain-containing protein [Ureibacillus sp.]|nr:helix-hairpin-helix domain-containing protein [Ureibacillus sp.]
MILLYIFLQQGPSEEKETLTITTIPDEQSEEINSADAANEQVEAVSIEEIMVDVKGAVHSPGVYVFTTENRVIDAIERAGGYTQEAETTAVNHAQKLQDEMVIYIPKIGEEMDQSVSGQVVIAPAASTTESTAAQVDLNRADEAALTTLPGIGPSKAQAIIAYREENGSYKTIDDLKNVTGIGDKTFEKLKEFIVVK